MKIFIPEIGSRITLTEDWLVISGGIDSPSIRILEKDNLIEKNLDSEGFVKNRSFTVPKDTTMSIKTIAIKRGKSNTNCVTFYIPKNKMPDKRFGGIKFSVLLPDLVDLEFEMEECNEETKQFTFDFLYDIREEFGGKSSSYREVEKVILNGKSILSFSPQQTITSFTKSVMNRFEKYAYEGYGYRDEIEKVKKRFNTYNRVHKIEKVLDS